MIVYEQKMKKDNGEEYLLVTFNHHRAEIFRTEIPLKHERCSNLRIAKAKEKAIDEFLETSNGKKYTKKEVIKAYSKVDNYFKDLYKQLFPHGGKRDGNGRKTGTKFSNKTERFTQAISKEEKELLSEILKNHRKNEQKTQEEIKAALAPIFQRIDESFGDDEASRQKWQKKVGYINPALFPQLLEYIVLFGIDKLLPQEKKIDSLNYEHNGHLYSYIVSHEQKK